VAARVRRSAGSNSYLNRLLFRKQDPAQDLEDFRNGIAFKVAGLLRRFEDVGKPGTLLYGSLELSNGRPVIWQGRGGVTQLRAPFELNPLDGKLPFGRNFTRFLLSTAGGDYEIALPTIDIDLIRLALGIEAE
jgi:hypothetical protein